MVAKPRKRERARDVVASAELARACARVADGKKGEEIIILDLRRFTYVTDFFVIVTANNSRQMRAIARGIEQYLLERQVKPLGVEGTDASRWILVDCADFVVHVFEREWRKLYDLELLWGDAPRLEWESGEGA